MINRGGAVKGTKKRKESKSGKKLVNKEPSEQEKQTFCRYGRERVENKKKPSGIRGEISGNVIYLGRMWGGGG